MNQSNDLSSRKFASESHRLVSEAVSLMRRGIVISPSEKNIITAAYLYHKEHGRLLHTQSDKLGQILLQNKNTIKHPPNKFEKINKLPEAKTLEGAKVMPRIQRVIEYDQYRVKIILNSTVDTIKKIQTLPGAQFHKNGGEWLAFRLESSLKHLTGWGFKISPSVKQSFKSPEIVEAIPGFKQELKPFQKVGVAHAEMWDGRILIGDDMGLGKTAQALAYLQLHPEKRPAVIVCPASLKLNWKSEIQKFLGGNQKVFVLSGRPDKKNTGAVPKADIYIVNYDILSNKTRKEEKKEIYVNGKKIKQKQEKVKKITEFIPDTGWADWLLRHVDVKVLIADEAHKLKERDSNRTKAAFKLASKIPHILLLTGTPALNRPKELFSLLHILCPKLFPEFMVFARRYCNATKDAYQRWNFNGTSNKKELNEVLTSFCMVRRLKKDVLKELPPKIHSVVKMPIENRVEYNRAYRDLIAYLNGFDTERAMKAKKAEQLVKVGVLKKLAVLGKLNSCIEWVDNFLESGHKLVLFVYHREVIDRLSDAFKGRCVKVVGGMTAEQKHMAEVQYRTQEDTPLFIGGLEAASEGLNLVESSNVAYIEFGWNPGIMKQSADRVHRIGQNASTVNIWYLVAVDTIEERLISIISKKADDLNSILDGADDDEQEEVFTELLKELTCAGQSTSKGDVDSDDIPF